MSKHIFYPQEFFDEDDVRHLLASPQICTTKKLREISASLGVLLSKESSQKSLIADIAKIPFDWQRLNSLKKYLDSDERGAKPRTTKFKLPTTDIDLDKIVAEFKKRVGSITSDVEYQASGGTKSVITATYVEHKTGLLKGLQRIEVPAEIDLKLSGSTLEVSHGKADEVENLISILRYSLDEVLGGEKKAEKVEVNLFNVTAASEKSKFFTDLINQKENFEFISVPKVGLHQADSGSDDLEEDDNEAEEKEEKERALSSKIQSATLKGENVLVTQLYKDLAKDGYFLSFVQWECVEKSGSKRKALVQAFFKEPEIGTGFCVEVQSCYDPIEDGKFVSVPHKSRKTATESIRNKIMKYAFSLSKALTEKVRSEDEG